MPIKEFAIYTAAMISGAVVLAFSVVGWIS